MHVSGSEDSAYGGDGDHAIRKDCGTIYMISYIMCCIFNSTIVAMRAICFVYIEA